jgi:hypothetical protein
VNSPSNALLQALMELCNRRYYALAKSGCDEDVAATRTFDCLQAALGEVPTCYDKRDRLFLKQLQEAAERTEHA